LPTGPVLFVASGGNFSKGEESLYFNGRVAARAETVEAFVNGASVNPRIVEIGEPFVRRFRLGQPFKYFIGFFDVRRGGVLSVIARDADGQVIAKRRSRITNVEVLQASQCRFARQTLKEGLMKHRTAVRNVRESCLGLGDISDVGRNPLGPSG
jgi:hypothetical protein